MLLVAGSMEPLANFGWQESPWARRGPLRRTRRAGTIVDIVSRSMALAALDVKRGGMRANLGQEYTQRMCAMDIKRVMSFDLQTFAKLGRFLAR